jgi:hypothetical protein
VTLAMAVVVLTSVLVTVATAVRLAVTVVVVGELGERRLGRGYASINAEYQRKRTRL